MRRVILCWPSFQTRIGSTRVGLLVCNMEGRGGEGEGRTGGRGGEEGKGGGEGEEERRGGEGEEEGKGGEGRE